MIDYAKPDLLLFNTTFVQLLTTISVFIFVPARAHHHSPYYAENHNGSYKEAMILLLVTNIVIFLGESSEIFHKSKVRVTFSGFKRVTAFIIAVPLYIATIVVTVKSHGKELVWLIWLTMSLSITAAQILNQFFHVILECYNSQKAKKAFQLRV